MSEDSLDGLMGHLTRSLDELEALGPWPPWWKFWRDPTPWVYAWARVNVARAVCENLARVHGDEGQRERARALLDRAERAAPHEVLA